jgi:hypothetical protein
MTPAWEKVICRRTPQGTFTTAEKKASRRRTERLEPHDLGPAVVALRAAAAPGEVTSHAGAARGAGGRGRLGGVREIRHASASRMIEAELAARMSPGVAGGRPTTPSARTARWGTDPRPRSRAAPVRSSRPGGFRPQASHRTGLVDRTSGSLGFSLTGRTAVFDQRPVSGAG